MPSTLVRPAIDCMSNKNQGDISMSIHRLALAVGLTAGQAYAALYTVATGFGPVDEDFESFDGLVVPSPWPVLIAGGEVIVASDIDMTLGAFAVALNENGTWGAGNDFAGLVGARARHARTSVPAGKKYSPPRRRHAQAASALGAVPARGTRNQAA